jgi:hypothetical protein
LLNNASEIPSGEILTVILNEILMPPCLKPLTGLEVFSGDEDYYQVEVATYM